MNSSSGDSPPTIYLNIGGKKFCTTVDTLTLREPDSRLAAMFTVERQDSKKEYKFSDSMPMLTMFGGRDNDNCHESKYIVIDRDGKHFRHILNWLRDGAVPIMENHDYEELLREAEYFKLRILIREIKARICLIKPDFTRTDIIKLLQSGEKLLLQGVNLSGVDLSGLDLNGANLAKANLNRANLEGANLEGATLEEADMRGANLSDANLKRANLQRVNCANLKGANIEGATFHNGLFRGFSQSFKLTRMFSRSRSVAGANNFSVSVQTES